MEGNKSEVKTELCRPQIWSKQSVGFALKMRGFTVKWKRSRARTDPRIIAKEDIQVTSVVWVNGRVREIASAARSDKGRALRGLSLNSRGKERGFVDDW